MSISLDRLRRGFALVGSDRGATDWFSRLWDRTMGTIERNDADIRAALAAAGIAVREGQNAQSQAQTAAATANSAAAGKAAASVVGVGWTGPTTSWQTVASVDLTGVVAGTLRFDTTRIYASASATASEAAALYSLQFRIRESGGTVLYGPATVTVEVFEGTVSITIFDVAPLDAARPAVVTTGAVTYELQLQGTGAVSIISGGLADFRVAQA